jgi:hypothetical protein
MRWVVAAATAFEIHAAWSLVVAYVLSLSYEVWRATVKAGTSRHDSTRSFITQGLPLYIVAAIVIGLLFAGVAGAAWVGLIFSILVIGVSIFYYNPVVMAERSPGLIDWFEDLAYTGLHFVAAAVLLYEVSGKSLVG